MNSLYHMNTLDTKAQTYHDLIIYNRLTGRITVGFLRLKRHLRNGTHKKKVNGDPYAYPM